MPARADKGTLAGSAQALQSFVLLSDGSLQLLLSVLQPVEQSHLIGFLSTNGPMHPQMARLDFTAPGKLFLLVFFSCLDLQTHMNFRGSLGCVGIPKELFSVAHLIVRPCRSLGCSR